MSLTAIIPLITSIFGTIGSTVVRRDEESGKIEISSIGGVSVCYVASVIGCSTSDQPFSECMVATGSLITQLFGG